MVPVPIEGVGIAGECYVTEHDDGHMTWEFVPPNTATVKVSRELLEIMLTDLNTLRRIQRATR